MAEVLAEIYATKKYVSLDLSPMTGSILDLAFLHGNGEEYIVSLKLSGTVRSIADSFDRFGDRFLSLTSVTIPDKRKMTHFTQLQS